MKRTAIVTTLVALGTVALAGVASARNPHCAGGIQYVVQSLRDKDHGNVDDYRREINKAVQQLEECAVEDTMDYEALGYLAWAYAEVDSSRQAGQAFGKAIAGLEVHDKKKVDWARQNRESYWTTAFNLGITKINEAQALWPDFSKPTAGDADTRLKDQARDKYGAAIVSLTHAEHLKPGDARSLRNLGSVYALMGDYPTAQKYFEQGLVSAPNDSDLVRSLQSVRQQRAGSLIDDKKFDEAISYYNDLAKSDPNNSDVYLGLAEAHFKKAQSLDGDARKPEFKLAGDAYARAGEFKPASADLPFNAALAYQNAGETKLAEGQWRAALKAKPNDPDALSALGGTLADLNKYDEAVTVLHQAVMADPKNKTYHRQLGAAYTKAGNTQKGTEEFMVYLALNSAGDQPVDAVAQSKRAPAGSAAAKTLAALGTPDQIAKWSGSGQDYESWFYWTKSVAFHFSPQGAQVQKSDWSTVGQTAKK